MQDIPFAVKRHPLRQSLDKRSACIGLHILAVYIVPQIKSPARAQSFLVVIHPVLGQQSTIFCGHALHIIRIPVVHFQPYGKLFFRMDARQLVHLSHMLFVPVYDFMRIDGRGNPLHADGQRMLPASLQSGQGLSSRGLHSLGFSGFVLHFDIVYLRPGRQNDRIDRSRFLPHQQCVIIHPRSGKGRTTEVILGRPVQRHRIHRQRKIFIGKRVYLFSKDMRSQDMIGQVHRQFLIALSVRRESFAQKEQYHRKPVSELIIYIVILHFLGGQ